MRANVSPDEVRRSLRDGTEIALIDLREEGPYAQAHPLFAVCVPLSRIELVILDLIPRHDVPVVLYDDGEGLVQRALPVLRHLGYDNVSVLHGGLAGWRESGGELFRDVNVPSKAFGELVEAQRHTPSLPATELHRRLGAGEDLVVLDARRREEYAVMSIPTGRSVPGGELALRVRDAAPDPSTVVVVNCAGRTRSIIGAQSLINAGIPNPVFALRNGTIGWSLAGLSLNHGADRAAPAVSPASQQAAQRSAARLADWTGVGIIDANRLRALESSDSITLYQLDVRTPDEYAAGHLPGFRNAPGGQLVQATDEWIGVRHATIVLTDDDGVRARMAGHWLRQLGWRSVLVLDGWGDLAREEGVPSPTLPPPSSPAETVDPAALARLLESGRTLLIDVAASTDFARAHIPGARFAIRADLAALSNVRLAETLVLTSPDGVLALFAAADLTRAGLARPLVLAGGTIAWQRAGRPLSDGLEPKDALSATNDLYKRPYEGTDNVGAAMQAYLDWEFGLVEQLARDGTHGFSVLQLKASSGDSALEK